MHDVPKTLLALVAGADGLDKKWAGFGRNAALCWRTMDVSWPGLHWTLGDMGLEGYAEPGWDWGTHGSPRSF